MTEPKPAKLILSKEALEYIKTRADAVKVHKVEKPKPKPPKEKP